MVSTASQTKPLTCAISYGFLGGPAHSRRLRQLLSAKGYNCTADLEHADIILAHSAGCFLIPSDAHPKLVVYVGMPLAQDKAQSAWAKANHANIMAAFRDKAVTKVIKITLLSWYYGLRQPRRNWNILRTIKTATPSLPPGAAIAFIVNRYDPWPLGDTLQQYIQSNEGRQWTFMSLPGSHDDIWERPETYVAIIDYYARLLA
ncbi:MAG TPA: hypothetical protein VHD60_00565 [Candidatus Saccharimonadales bacterium]|nr:hypothetical protein [Candidatus Saccharimonadales bacterium]